jgi:hypothetical protein
LDQAQPPSTPSSRREHDIIELGGEIPPAARAELDEEDNPPGLTQTGIRPLRISSRMQSVNYCDSGTGLSGSSCGRRIEFRVR